MAISRGAGTEIIRTAHFEYIAANTTAQVLIFGVQHHIYTVLSLSFYNVQTATTDSNTTLATYIDGYDCIDGSNADTLLFRTGVTNGFSTFIYNDKISFNGHGPTDFAGGAGVDSIAKQDAIADQGGAVQKLMCQKGHNNDLWNISITYIDQNNA
jgi:hypothetical protein